MQHTEKYNFSLIDADDAFSPDALNANARQLEDQLARVEDGVAAETARVEDSLTAEVARLDAAAAAEKTRVNAALDAKAPQTEVARLETAAAAEKTRVNGEITKLNTAIGTGGTTARIVTGSYTGKGTWGSDNPNKLDFAKTLGTAPKLLFVMESDQHYTLCLIQNVTFQYPTMVLLNNPGCMITWTSTGLSWYSGEARGQMNEKKVYYYVAIG